MATAVQQLMSSPPVTCDAEVSLAEATVLMHSRRIGSVIVTDGRAVAGILTERDLLRATAGRAVAGILTERDLLRATAGRADPLAESVRNWMTPDPDVLGPDDEVGAA